MKNTLYEGLVIHHRHSPKEHKFTYKVTYYFFDLERSEELKTIPFLLSFNPKKYLNANSIRDSLNSKFDPEIVSQIEKIFVLTQLAYFGFSFNPVSFYYCYGKNDELLYIISQITNTPWGEKHIDCFDFQASNGDMSFSKNFHVSPFMPMEIDYHWIFSKPQESINIFMTNKHRDKPKVFFLVDMNLKAKELNYKNVLLNFLLYPLISFKTVAGIYWQALILYLKKIPFHTHPKKVSSNEY